MKKKMIALLAGALLTVAMAGNAMAAFENLHLIRIAYQTTGGTAEVATDLGSIDALLAGTAAGSTSFIQGGSAAGSLFNNTALSNINVAYLAYDTDQWESNPIYFSNGEATPNMSSPTSWQNSVNSLVGYYANLSTVAGGATQVVGSQSYANSYAQLFAFGGGTNSDGSLGTSIDTTVEANLGAGSATQHLWYIADTNNPVAVDLGTIVTNLDGTTTFTSNSAAATPIPASFLLMGSGLLGMIGLRRKKA